jgi:hypothetical protein
MSAAAPSVSSSRGVESRILCELLRERSAVRVLDVTLRSGARSINLVLYYRNMAGDLACAHTLSLSVDEAIELRGALGLLRTERSTHALEEAQERKEKTNE